uniref:Uncharacterized protein n=1 Tax=Romanomermis culicivorax TaxID=13658 RepID=A0A915HMT8_ROMCU
MRNYQKKSAKISKITVVRDAIFAQKRHDQNVFFQFDDVRATDAGSTHSEKK